MIFRRTVLAMGYTNFLVPSARISNPADHSNFKIFTM